ncbi:slit homolog 2 protein-like [Ptychodera flava]|uniref:slit homolog 2 protein-like n=1 Tax=Ptychodera flava TaxID=63121 RepID=UPI00396A04F4
MMEYTSKLASIICLVIISMNRLDGCPSTCYCSGTTVDCSNQRLREIPSGIPTNTTILRLERNLLTHIGNDSFTGLSKLTDLYMHSNRIEEVAVGAFTDLCRLSILDLYANSIRSLPQTVFLGLDDLTYIDLYGNKLSCLPENLFFGLHNLDTLHLDNNKITETTADCLRGLSNLNKLHLDHNEIIEISANIFRGLAKLPEIGDNVILDCEVESELEVDKYWIIPNGTVIYQSTEDMCSDYRIVQQGDGSLVIPFAEVDDEG